MRHVTLVVVIVALAVTVSPAVAGKGGNGNGNGSREPTGSCAVEGSVVTGVGLPTDEVINFMVIDASDTWGWVLGYTDDGTWTVPVPATGGPATYEFVSRTWGPSGSRYDVFASC